MNGYILAGGQSSRMGRDKALLPLDGKTFSSIIAQKMMDAGCDEVFLICKHPINSTIAQLYDHSKTYHPLFGVAIALEHTEQELCLISPCDIPYISIHSLTTLIRSQNPVVAMGQPLLGVFAKGMHNLALSYANRGQSVKDFIKDLRRVTLPLFELHNINYPSDIQEAHMQTITITTPPKQNISTEDLQNLLQGDVHIHEILVRKDSIGFDQAATHTHIHLLEQPFGLSLE